MTNLLLLKNKTVLFAEDDQIMREQTTEVLNMIFAKVYTAQDGEEAFVLYEDHSPDIIITDIKMPKKDGLKLIKQIRQKNYDIPIILLTSFAEYDMLLNAANLSVDGYLVKPIELEQLTLTICSSIQRAKKNLGLIQLDEELCYNTGTQEIYHKGVSIPFGQKEQELLLLLLHNRFRTVTKEEIATTLWPLDPICESAIKNLILRIRKKVGTDIVLSVRGIGYRLNTRGVSREDKLPKNIYARLQ